MTSFFKGTNRGLYGDNARKPPFSPVIVSSRFHQVRQALPIVSHRLFSSPCPTVTPEVESSSLVHPATKHQAIARNVVRPLKPRALRWRWIRRVLCRYAPRTLMAEAAQNLFGLQIDVS